MKVYTQPDPTEWDELLKRPRIEDSLIRPRVEAILDDVRREGDTALRRYARQLDGAELTDLAVTPEEIDAAVAAVDKNLGDAIRHAALNIEKFHRAQRFSGIDVSIAPGITCWQRSVPIQRVGLYVPGGSAPLFSTVLMLAIPARIAECPEIVLCSPPNREGKIADVILFAAKLCGVTKIFKAGGAQAIAAMAYGTESVPKVDKIFGPGNQYVTVAKQLVSVSDVAIDMPAGPSEVMVLADETANPRFVAADLLSQAEHGPDSQSILVTDSPALASRVEQKVAIQLQTLSRRELAARSIENSRIFVLNSRSEMIALANRYAAEHLILSVADARQVAEQITAAGSIFIGNYTPESAGDYASGTNHTLPTSGWAASYSGVNLDSFMRKITYQEITRQGLEHLGGVIEAMARAEGLDAHARAVTLRLED
ncbi:MAG: histidinol dehydrogenase [Rikenellaceae bacterium]|jgi:histidinol dehydrogenase|nr:histidinol dehydrogenase [Rikenellaceae bacterium]